MVWRRVQPTAAEPKGVNAERESPPPGPRSPHDAGLVAAALWSHPDEGGPAARLGRATVQRHVAAYRDGGPGGPRRRDVTGPVSDLASFTDAIRDSLNAAPVRTAPEACDRIGRLTGPRREPTRVRTFLKALGFRRRRIRASPIPPQKTWLTTPGGDWELLGARRRPRLDAAPAGNTCSSWTPPPSYSVRSCVACGRSRGRSSGRRRFDVPGAWNAVARELAAITDATVANGETMCDLPRTIAARGLRGPVAPVLDDARCQRNAPVQGLAKGLRIARLFLPNPNPIGRLRRFMKRQRPTGAITRRSPTSEPALRMSLVGCPRLTRASRPPS